MIIRTGKTLERDVFERLKALYIEARNVPVILLTQRHLGPMGQTENQIALDRWYEAMNVAAVELGLPKPAVDDDGDVCNYGLDFTTGEVLGWAPDSEVQA
jgi:hypothetical protein